MYRCKRWKHYTTRKDEEYFRKTLELPEAEEAVKNAWDDDGSARRPITLKSQDAFEEEQNQIIENEDEDSSD